MQALQLTIRDFPISPAIETHIRKKAQKLNQYYDRISNCRVVVDLETKHKHQGKLFNVRIEVTVPGKELVTTYKSDEDVYVAIRDAFHAISRQLEEHARKRHGRVKTHNNIMHGTIVRLRMNEGYGFIEGIDGNEYYFGMTNVSYPRFNQLAIGDSVQYVAEPLSEGRQAQHIVRDRHNHLEE